MLVKLKTNNFSFLKVLFGGIFLCFFIIYPETSLYASVVVLFTGVAHFFGAWISMWRANKLNWKYVSCTLFLIFFISYLGYTMETPYFIFTAYLLFLFHFMYDEFDLQEEKRSINNIISSLNPTILILFSLLKEFLHFDINMYILFIVAIVLFLIEMFFIKEISWFFIHTKILLIFILASLHLGFSGITILNLFLVYHYLFWFVYPVYKLHVYKREERDGLIMILLLTVATSAYLTLTRSFSANSYFGIVPISFYIGSIIHILSTAPFGYLIGLPKPKYEVS